MSFFPRVWKISLWLEMSNKMENFVACKIYWCINYDINIVTYYDGICQVQHGTVRLRGDQGRHRERIWNRCGSNGSYKVSRFHYVFGYKLLLTDKRYKLQGVTTIFLESHNFQMPVILFKSSIVSSKILMVLQTTPMLTDIQLECRHIYVSSSRKLQA